jgi:hypothetical protein
MMLIGNKPQPKATITLTVENPALIQAMPIHPKW